MTVSTFGELDRTRPLVAVVCAVPLLGEAMSAALDFAEVRAFSERSGDVEGLLRWVRPDAVVVDSDCGADAAQRFADGKSLPVLHICVRTDELRTLRDGEWHNIGNGEGPTPEAIRNVVAGALFARERVQ